MQPNLFIVGFQKCGSSSLFDKLIGHSDIEGTEPKETFALCDDDYEHFDKTKNIVSSQFQWGSYFSQSIDAVKRKYYLEASVCNFYQERALDYISTLKEKKVIFIVRNPIDRFRSTFDYYGKSITDFGVLSTLDRYYEIISEDSDKISKEGARYSIEHGMYSKYIDLWENSLGKENILVVSFKNLLKKPESEFKAISEFLGIEEFKNIDVAHANKSVNVKNKLLDHYGRRLFRGSGLGQTFVGKMYKKLNSTSTNTIISNDLQDKLQKIYQKEFERYGDLF